MRNATPVVLTMTFSVPAPALMSVPRLVKVLTPPPPYIWSVLSDSARITPLFSIKPAVMAMGPPVQRISPWFSMVRSSTWVLPLTSRHPLPAMTVRPAPVMAPPVQADWSEVKTAVPAPASAPPERTSAPEVVKLDSTTSVPLDIATVGPLRAPVNVVVPVNSCERTPLPEIGLEMAWVPPRVNVTPASSVNAPLLVPPDLARISPAVIATLPCC